MKICAAYGVNQFAVCCDYKGYVIKETCAVNETQSPYRGARAARLPVVAAEKDYVRDVVEPAQTFDPESAVSIVRAVRRFLSVPPNSASRLTPRELLEALTADSLPVSTPANAALERRGRNLVQ